MQEHDIVVKIVRARLQVVQHAAKCLAGVNRVEQYRGIVWDQTACHNDLCDQWQVQTLPGRIIFASPGSRGERDSEHVLINSG
jgi:hypothetical protein